MEKLARDMIMAEYRETLEAHMIAINAVAAAKQWLDSIGDYRANSPAGRFAVEYEKLVDHIDGKKRR